jgi:hypothetical protein
VILGGAGNVKQTVKGVKVLDVFAVFHVLEVDKLLMLTMEI